MRLTLAGCYLLYALTAFAQSDRGTITGTVLDSGRRHAVPNAAIEAKNQETSAVFSGCQHEHRQLHTRTDTGRHLSIDGYRRRVQKVYPSRDHHPGGGDRSRGPEARSGRHKRFHHSQRRGAVAENGERRSEPSGRLCRSGRVASVYHQWHGRQRRFLEIFAIR